MVRRLCLRTTGAVLKGVAIDQKGKGQVNVDLSDLAVGSYMYSLIIDGELIDTKKMIVQK